MHAYSLARYGKTNASLALQDVPTKSLLPDEVRIDVHAVAINPVDLKTREGEPRMLLPFSPPFVPGVDLAGVVCEAGSAVSSLRVGDPVFAYAGMDRMGAFAEQVSLPAARVARRPAALAAEEASCLPLPGLCALQALDEGRIEKGMRVLIHGGAGGVGSVAVQLAAQRGAEVFTTASASDSDRVRALGAAHVIDHRTARFEDTAREVDLVLDTVGGETLKRSWSSVKRGGTVASLHVPPPADALAAAGLRAPWFLRALLPLATLGPRSAAKRAGARLVPILTVPDAAALDRIARAAESPGLRVLIGQVFAFDELAAALDLVAGGRAKGRVVLRREPGRR